MQIRIYKFRFDSRSFLWATVALLAGASVIYIGDLLLGVDFPIFLGLYTFSPLWLLNLILVPMIAGVVVSAIYGLGGKILAYFAPLLVRVPEYLMMDSSTIPEGALPLPLGYWLLLLIVVVEAAAGGGIFGEFFIKKIYGRRPKHLIHKKYAKPESKESIEEVSSPTQPQAARAGE